MKGKVKIYDSERGCGIIVDAESGKQLVLYANNINLKEGETLNTGQDVTYNIENRRHEHWAVNVEISEERENLSKNS